MKRVPTLSKYIDDKSKEGFIEKRDYVEFTTDILHFNEFWQSTPILAHFVPCDKNGKPLEKPFSYDNFIRAHHIKTHREWEEALGRTKWSGWGVEHINKAGVYLNYKGKITAFAFFKDGRMDFNSGEGLFEAMKTYESIITANITLEATEGYAKTLKLK